MSRPLELRPISNEEGNRLLRMEADTLMEALWPDEAPDHERLNRHTSRARTTLGTGYPTASPMFPTSMTGSIRSAHT